MRGMLRGRIGLCLVAAGLCLAAMAGTASAATVTVTTTQDSGTGSLRQLIDDAFDNDVIVVPAGTYILTSGEISIGTSITIRGAGARRTIIGGGDSVRPFVIPAAGDETAFERLTIRDGYAASDDGGAIETSSDLTLDGVALLSNHAEVTSNNSGGALSTNGSAEVTIRDSLIAGNMAYNGGATDIGDVTVTNSTIANNTAGSPGDNGNSGGLRASSATVRNSTIVGNRCFNGDGCGAGTDLSTLDLKNSVLAGNTAYEFNGQPPGSAGNPGQPENCADDTATDQGGNVESLSDCETGPASRQNANPNLGPLANNGGQTDTMALLAGSPAIGFGSGCEPADQRGLLRSLGGPCDSGAYERVLCAGVAVNRFGTAGRDTLVGTSAADGILGFGGRDLIRALAGKDALCGGAGPDRLLGGAGGDLLLGQAGRDRLVGGKGRDRLFGGKGRDRLFGGKGRDRLLGGKGRDLLRGGPGRDRLRGGPGRDRQVQ